MLAWRTSSCRTWRPACGTSKKAEMHAHSIALHFMYFNFARIHQTLRVTAAMEARVSNRPWSIGKIVALA
jgi:hypothetical protein